MLQPAGGDDPLQELLCPGLARLAEHVRRRAPARGSLPPSRKQTRLATSRANPISWVAMTIVMPPRASSRITLRTSATSSGSKRASDLVEEKQVRRHGQGAHDRDALLLAPREPIGILVALVGKPELLEQLGRVGLRPRPRLAGGLLRRERHVAQDRHMREEVERLEHDPNAPPHPVDVHARRRDLLALYQDAARVDRLQQVDATKQRRLAATGRADQADDFVFGDGKVDAAQNLQLTERLPEPRDLQGGPRGSRTIPSAPPQARSSRVRQEAAPISSHEPVGEPRQRDGDDQEDQRQRPRTGWS